MIVENNNSSEVRLNTEILKTSLYLITFYNNNGLSSTSKFIKTD